MESKLKLEAMSLAELEALADAVSTAIVSKREAVKAELRERFRKEAEAQGLSFEEVTGGAKSRGAKRTSTVAPKYRHPSDSSKTWTGKGRKPSWLNELLDDGAKLEDFAV
jgi:DNA-binding protein H-NS